MYTKTNINNVLLNKVDTTTLTSYHTNTQIDTTFTKYYSKTYVHAIFTNYYSKTYIDTNFYNKTQSDNLWIAKQDTTADGDLTIAKTNGLQTALDGKVDDSQVLTNVPSGATFSFPEIWTGTSNTYTEIPTLYFVNVDTPTLNLGVGSDGYGAFTMKATPSLNDISNITVASANISSGKPFTHVLANDPGFGTEAPFQYHDQHYGTPSVSTIW